MTPIKVAFILGDGYSGSTLLDLMLGSHSRIVGLGEIDAESFDAFWDQDQLCTCLFTARKCHFWGKVLQRVCEHTGRESFRLGPVNGDSGRITQNTLDLYRAISDVSSADILVDSSKRFERTVRLAATGVIEPKLIHLVRDGRGVAYSYLKRGGSFEDAVVGWKNKNEEISNWFKSANAPDNIIIRYEDLCAQTVEIGQRICEFLGVNWEPQIMRFGQKVHHNVRGNTMRFLINNSVVRLDELWKEKLGESHLTLFEELAGSASRQMGYH